LVGRPTLEKCKEIKEKREHRLEMEIIDEKNIVESKLRSAVRPEKITPKSAPSSFDYLTRLGDSE
jgi:hypothetical protein